MFFPLRKHYEAFVAEPKMSFIYLSSITALHLIHKRILEHLHVNAQLELDGNFKIEIEIMIRHQSVHIVMKRTIEFWGLL
jgi:hypothetical protein